jgi:hypothetical protein
MSQKNPVDWSSVDWSKQNRDIAEELERSPCHVCTMRKRLGRPRPKYWYKPKSHPAYLERWRKVDWRLTNVVIARQMGVSQQRVHEIRRLLKQPKATIKPLRPAVLARLNRVRSNLHRLRGLTMTQAARLLGMKLNSRSTARQYLDQQGVLRDGTRKHPWHLMNFRLGNTALAGIWEIDRGIVASFRSRQKIGPPRWNGNTYRFDSAKEGTNGYHRTVFDERTKAQAFRNGDDVSVCSRATIPLAVTAPPGFSNLSLLDNRLDRGREQSAGCAK